VIEIGDPPIQIPADVTEPIYFASLIAGLEPVVADELAEKLPEARLLGVLRGRLFFSYAGPPADTVELLTVENVFGYAAQLTEIPATEDGLDFIEQALVGIDLSGALALHEELHGAKTDPCFRITGQRAGRHAYKSPAIAAAAGSGVVHRYGWRVDLEKYDYDVRVYVTDDSALVGVRLSPEALHRRARVVHGAASLNPTVAHAMCRLSRPAPGQVFVDPMCGAGTILVERAGWGDGPLLIGGDAYVAPLHLAQQNLTASDASAGLINWDGRRLALATGSVDALVCNMPWGRRIGSHVTNVHLYPGFIREVVRVVRPGGVAVLLTQEKRLITRLIDKHPALALQDTLTLSLSGLHPSIYVIQRVE